MTGYNNTRQKQQKMTNIGNKADFDPATWSGNNPKQHEISKNSEFITKSGKMLRKIFVSGSVT